MFRSFSSLSIDVLKSISTCDHWVPYGDGAFPQIARNTLVFDASIFVGKSVETKRKNHRIGQQQSMLAADDGFFTLLRMGLTRHTRLS